MSIKKLLASGFMTELMLKRELNKHGIEVVSIKHDKSQGVYSTFLPYTVRFNYQGAECVRVGATLDRAYDRIMHDFVTPDGTMRRHTMLIDDIVKRVGGYRVNRDAWIYHVPLKHRSNKNAVHNFEIERDIDSDRLQLNAKRYGQTVDSVFIKDARGAIAFINRH